MAWCKSQKTLLHQLIMYKTNGMDGFCGVVELESDFHIGFER